MATVSVQRHIDVSPDQAWEALADWGGLHERLVPGFVTDVQLDGGDRLVTFFTGMTLRERLIGSDGEQRRLAWSILDGPYSHHNGVGQMFAEPDGGTRFVWTADLLPDEAAAQTQQMMERGIDTAKATLEQAAAG
ncbi:MAG TPA: SRPBCC family protein [Solirubrobacteraceae bacterium]|nr:SRPBCC family protein [Solirubrobacteraceae bacterium]